MYQALYRKYRPKKFDDVIGLERLHAVHLNDSMNPLGAHKDRHQKIGQGYIGFSESMRLLKDRSDQTWIKSVSFSDRENTARVYADAAAVTAGVTGQRYEKCLKLMNVMAEARILTALSVQEGEPQYLLLARRSAYAPLVEQFPIYGQLEKLGANAENHIILVPDPYSGETPAEPADPVGRGETETRCFTAVCQ